MKRNFLMHGSWALVTILTFVLGSQWGRPGAHHRPDGERPHLSGAGDPSGSDRSGKSRGRRDRTARAKADGSVGKSVGEAGTPRRVPLASDEIESLVLASIKAGGPVARRLAFDRLLEEIQSSTFTEEQALAIRAAMVEHGANAQQWKLFDYAWAANQPEAAIAYLDEIPAEQRDRFLSNMIPGLASENPRMAIDLFGGLDSELQATVRPRLFEGLVDYDTDFATDYLYESTNPENYNWRPMAELTRELVRDQGLDSTLDWAAELPVGSQRRDAWSAAYAVWASQDPHAAVQSIMELPDGSDRNLAINGFVSAHVHRDGERALTWITDIDEPGLRDAAMIRVGRQFYERDPQGATQWFASSGLPQTVWAQVTNSERRP